MSRHGGSGSGGLRGPGDWRGNGRPPFLSAEERPRYALASADGFEHTTEGRTTTSEPADGQRAYLLATDRRVLVFLGDRPAEPDVDIAYELVAECRLDGGLLSTTVAVETQDESVRISPSAGDAGATVEFVDAMASYWRELATHLSEAREAIEKIESAADASNYDVTRAREHLSEARAVVEDAGEAATDAMTAYVETVEEELEAARTDSLALAARESLDRTEEALVAATEALAADDYRSACGSYVEATDALERASESLDGLEDQEALAERLADCEDHVHEFGDEFLADAAAAYERAQAADDPEAAVTAWQSAFDRYRGAVAAGWDGQRGVSEATLTFQLVWVTAALVDALETLAATREERGDDAADDDAAVTHYEEAVDALERARDLAEEHPAYSADAFADEVERVTDKKLDATGWQWGAAGAED